MWVYVVIEHLLLPYCCDYGYIVIAVFSNRENAEKYVKKHFSEYYIKERLVEIIPFKVR